MMGNKKIQNISFHFLVPHFSFPRRTLLKQHLTVLFKFEKKKFESITYVFCTDDYLLAINKDFLGHNYYTDIITFNLAEPGRFITGEIYVSVDRVRDNTEQLQEPFGKELARVVFHGALHLCGYNDKSVAENITMREKEDFYLNRFNKNW